ncbi:glutathione S-transferase C-terminal domain-containing protein [Pseudomonas sp. 14P_8.1_Bac3]|nr:glutathione S-transferase C-terminal domain-containing protein [Pseudomonas sp. 14P_8.1_Bac3]
MHFLHHAPEDLAYAKNRYLKEVERHYRVLDQRLADHPYLAGDTYSIADMALWGWASYAVHPWRKRPGRVPERETPVRRNQRPPGRATRPGSGRETGAESRVR